MISQRKISRRFFLRLAGWAGMLGIVRPTLLVADTRWAHPGVDLTSRLPGIFRNRRSAGVIGNEYLRGRHEEARVQALIDLICQSPPLSRESSVEKYSKGPHAFPGEQVRADFEHDRVVKVNGWILSETEARLCALAALSRSGS